MNWNKLIMAGLVVSCMIASSGCKPKSEQAQKEEPMKAPAAAKLDVSFKVIPEQPVPNMTPTLQATVKQNNIAITDAIVDLEVWKDGTKEHQIVKASNNKDGTYTADSPLTDTGDYKVIVHVNTPNGMEQTINSNYIVKKKSKCCEGH